MRRVALIFPPTNLPARFRVLRNIRENFVSVKNKTVTQIALVVAHTNSFNCN